MNQQQLLEEIDRKLAEILKKLEELRKARPR